MQKTELKLIHFNERPTSDANRYLTETIEVRAIVNTKKCTLINVTSRSKDKSSAL